MKTLISALVLAVLLPLSKNNDLTDLYFLEGTWKTVNKENYEVWQKNADGSMEGYGYKMKDGEKVITEYLSLKIIDGQPTLLARVPNQNNNQTIAFRRNEAIKDKVSFENLAHDFPKKIQYKSLNETTIQVSVLNAEDKGFVYKILKQ